MAVASAFRLRMSSGDIAVNMPQLESLLAEIRDCFLNRRGFAVATLNLDHLVKLRGGGAFRRAYGAQDYVVADGAPVVWLSRLARNPVQLVPGSDLIDPLTRLAAREGVPVALVGSTAQALAGAAISLRQNAPGLKIATMIAPSHGFDPEGDEAADVLEQLKASGAGLTLLALGAPKQEIFAARGRAELPSMGFASIGAGLDFLAGVQTRAPRWVRRLALEWLWRAAGNPRRLAGRYLRCAMILPGLAWSAATSRG